MIEKLSEDEVFNALQNGNNAPMFHIGEDTADPRPAPVHSSSVEGATSRQNSCAGISLNAITVLNHNSLSASEDENLNGSSSRRESEAAPGGRGFRPALLKLTSSMKGIRGSQESQNDVEMGVLPKPKSLKTAIGLARRKLSE